MSDIDTEIAELLRRQRELIEQKAQLRQQAKEITETLKSMASRLRELKKAQKFDGDKMKRDIEILVMRYGEGVSTREIALKFNRSHAWPAWRCGIAMRYLRHPARAQERAEIMVRIEEMNPGKTRFW